MPEAVALLASTLDLPYVNRPGSGGDLETTYTMHLSNLSICLNMVDLIPSHPTCLPSHLE